MGKTRPGGKQIQDGSVGRPDINTVDAGESLITRVIAGTNVTITSTGVDSGTGDVTINASGSGGSSAINIDGGRADSLYLPDMCYDGGDASGN